MLDDGWKHNTMTQIQSAVLETKKKAIYSTNVKTYLTNITLWSLVLVTEKQIVVPNINLNQKTVFQQGSLFILPISLLWGFILLTHIKSKDK